MPICRMKILLATITLSACANQQFQVARVPAGTEARPCHLDIANPARQIDAFSDTRTAVMTVGADGGWCGYYVNLFSIDSPLNWQSGAVSRPPSQGEARLRLSPAAIQGSQVFVEYKATPGATGTDDFAVALQPGGALRQVHVEIVAPSSNPSSAEPYVGITTSTIPRGYPWRID